MQPLLKRQRGHGQQEAPILALDCGSSCHELDPLHPVVFLKKGCASHGVSTAAGAMRVICEGFERFDVGTSIYHQCSAEV